MIINIFKKKKNDMEKAPDTQASASAYVPKKTAGPTASQPVSAARTQNTPDTQDTPETMPVEKAERKHGKRAGKAEKNQADPLAAADPGVRFWPVSRAVGIDVSDATIKAAEIRRTRNGFVIEAHNSIGLPEGTIFQGEIRNEKVFKELLIKLFTEATPRPINNKYVLVSLPETLIYLHSFEFPGTMTEKNISAALPFEVERELPISLKNMYWDATFHLSRDRKVHHAIFATAPKKIVDAYVSVFSQARLRPVAFELDAPSLIRCLVEKKEEPVAILEIGSWSSKISIVERGMGHGFINVSVGGYHLTQLIAEALGTDKKQAEVIKIEQGMLGSEPKIRGILEKNAALLAQELINFSASHEQHTGRPVQEFYLAGGASKLKGLREYLEKATGRPVVHGDPFKATALVFSDKYSDEQKRSVADSAPSFISVIGLGIRGTRRDMAESGLNLLPLAVKKRYLEWPRHLMLNAAAFVSFVFLAVLFGLSSGWIGSLILERNILQYQTELQNESAFIRDLRQVSRMTLSTNAMLEQLAAFTAKREPYDAYLEKTVGLLGNGVRLTALTAEKADTKAPAAAVIKGIATDRETVIALADTFKKADFIASVDSPVENLVVPINAPFEIRIIFKRTDAK